MIKNEKNVSSNEESIELKRKSSKIMFVFILFLFFLSFYLVWAQVWKWFLDRIISPLYVLLLISLNLFIFFSTQKIFFDKKIISYIISGIFIAISIFFILPVII